MEKRLKHYDIYFLEWVKFIGCISKMEFDYLKANPQSRGESGASRHNILIQS